MQVVAIGKPEMLVLPTTYRPISWKEINSELYE